MRDLVKSVARAVAALVVAPLVASYYLRSFVIGRDRALEGSAETLSGVPGLVGQYLRRAFLTRVVGECAPSAVIGFGTLFSQCGCRIEDSVYIGPRCHLGLVHLERNVLLAAGVHIPSGGSTHGTSDVVRPIRDQPGIRRIVRIGEGTWIGSAAVVMADVGRHCVIGAGAVVAQPIPDYSVAVGVPARVVRSRRVEQAGA